MAHKANAMTTTTTAIIATSKATTKALKPTTSTTKKITASKTTAAAIMTMTSTTAKDMSNNLMNINSNVKINSNKAATCRTIIPTGITMSRTNS